MMQWFIQYKLFDRVEKATENLRQEYEAFEKHRSQMCADYARQVDPNEWVKLNVGGVSYNYRRSILTSVEGSMLEAVFSGRWEATLPRDNQGRIFIDENPVIFGEVVRYLHTLEVKV